MNTQNKIQNVKIPSIILLLIIIVNCQLSIFNCSAQAKQFYSIEYSTGKLLGSSSDFVSNYSWRGAQFNGQIFLIGNLAVGFKLGFNNYYSNVAPRLYDYGNGFRVYANTYRYVRQVPFQVGAVGHLFPNRIFKPYAGLFIGLCYATQSVFIQEVKSRTENYGFILTPELGFYLKFGKRVPAGIKVAAAYNLATNKYKHGMNDFKDLQSFNVNIGLACMLSRR